MPDVDNIPYVSVAKQLLDINEFQDIPVIGALWHAGNVVVDFFESDCNPDWHVYAETLLPEIGQVVLVLVSFGLDDVLRGYFRPAGGRGFGGLGRSSRRAKKLSKAEKALGKLEGGIPEIGEELGRHLPGATIVKARRVGSAEKFLWRLDGLAQRGLWYWMIADIAEDFTVNWTTALYKSEDCRHLEVAGLVRSNTATAIPLTDYFTGVILPTVEQEWGELTHTQQFVHLTEGQHGHMVFSSTVSQWNDTPSRVRLAILGPGGFVIATSGPASPTPTDPGAELMVSASIRGPGFYSWASQSLDALATLDNPEVTVIIEGGPA